MARNAVDVKSRRIRFDHAFSCHFVFAVYRWCFSMPSPSKKVARR